MPACRNWGQINLHATREEGRKTGRGREGGRERGGMDDRTGGKEGGREEGRDNVSLIAREVWFNV